jgi:beta-aspartyl-peptidase (threonine type)
MAEWNWAIVVHGGAKTIAPARAEAHRAGCRVAAEAGARVLRAGGTALEATRVAIRALEDDPTFNAGTGSVRNAAGEIEMDAAIMDGATLAIGAVAAVRRLRNPIDAAYAMLDAPPILLAGDGAELFARDRGLALCDPDATHAAASDPGHDTVGCVALDRLGHVAAATSTGGLEGTLPGRVGDSPMPGCGFYAEDGVGGVSLSGDGEAIARTLLAARVMRMLEHGTAGAAVTAIAAPLERVGGEAGAIALDRTGRIGMAHTSDHFAVALAASDLDAVHGAIHADDLKDFLDHG